jgi:hypothetical protein
LQTEDPAVAAAQIVTEADLIRSELRAMLDGLNGSRPSKAVMQRARQLRERAKALDATAGRLLRREMAIQVALRQRLGRTDVEGEEITPLDEHIAERILAGLHLC